MAVKVKKDGRVVRTGKDYTAFRYELYMSQLGKCAECGCQTSLVLDAWNSNSFHVHHVNGRGMGGGKHSDTFLACVGLCGKDHRRKHETTR